jgi:hypothetical protein
MTYSFMVTTISVAFLAITGTVLQALGQIQGGQQTGGDKVPDCVDLMSTPIVLDLIAELQTRINIICATDRMIALSFQEPETNFGMIAIDYFMLNGNYTLDTVTTSGMGSEANPTRF